MVKIGAVSSELCHSEELGFGGNPSMRGIPSDMQGIPSRKCLRELGRTRNVGARLIQGARPRTQGVQGGTRGVQGSE